jgi:hypothetical protein
MYLAIRRRWAMGKEDETAQPPIPGRIALAQDILDEVFDSEVSDSLTLIVRHIERLGTDDRDSDFELFLQSLWHCFEGLRLIREEGNFDLAADAQASAVAGFERLEIREMTSLSRTLLTHTQAVIEIRRLNVAHAQRLLDEAEKNLRAAGRFEQKYRPLIDHMKPDALFVGAIQALQLADFDSAKSLIARAAESSEEIAGKYYEVGTQSHFAFLGLARFYMAIFSYFQANRDLTRLELDRLVSEPDISANARDAVSLLSQSDLGIVVLRTSRDQSKALVELLEVSREVARHLRLCLTSSFKHDAKGFQELRAKVRKAADDVSKSGPQALPFLRTCEDLVARINNLERLARPKKRDFGIFSGLISCALFVPLLLAVAWANGAFGIGLEPGMMFSMIAVLALIGGFGFGALRFKGMLFPGKQDEGPA